MSKLLQTQDVALISVIENLLTEAGIPYHVADRTMSLMEGSIIAIQPRILVPDEYDAEARQLLIDADLGEWV
ncbi:MULTISPECIES: DUF2007 domain-containing protein [unclassified Nocardioides]|uniref:putative signal transducing protein n=1 Tax=unclassified Nocardioides TaxID=2615069 RepID=UPI00360FCB88